MANAVKPWCSIFEKVSSDRGDTKFMTMTNQARASGGYNFHL